MYDFLIVGAGITGITLAERLANHGKKVLLIEKRNRIGGNCYDYLDNNGILIHKYGPHIFHTDKKKVFDYIKKFTELSNYKHKVIAFYKGKYYPIPINRDTINIFYNKKLKNGEELKSFLNHKKIKVNEVKNSRDAVVSKFGEGLYRAFIKHYTKKQWGKYPEELDKSVLQRLPIRYDTNPYYFDDQFQGMPKQGFTKMFKKMLDNENISIKLNTDFFTHKGGFKYRKIIFTGKIDQFFNYKLGRLEYRGMKFILETLEKEDFQPNSVVNYTDKTPKFTRITEFKKLYGTKSKKTVICKEYSTWGGEPSYPMMDNKNLKLFKKYLNKAKTLKNVYFAGRLGTFSYLNMDKAILGALRLYENSLKK